MTRNVKPKANKRLRSAQKRSIVAQLETLESRRLLATTQPDWFGRLNNGNDLCAAALIAPNFAVADVNCVGHEGVEDLNFVRGEVGSLETVEEIPVARIATRPDSESFINVAIVELAAESTGTPISVMPSDRGDLLEAGATVRRFAFDKELRFFETDLTIQPARTSAQQASFLRENDERLVLGNAAPESVSLCTPFPSGVVTATEGATEYLAGLSLGDRFSVCDGDTDEFLIRLDAFEDWLQQQTELPAPTSVSFDTTVAGEQDLVRIFLYDQQLAEQQTTELKLSSSRGDSETVTAHAIAPGRFMAEIQLNNTAVAFENGTLETENGNTVLARYLHAANEHTTHLAFDSLLIRTDDHGNTRGAATPIPLQQTTSGRFELSGDEDWFAVDVPASTTVSFELEKPGTSGAAPVARWFTANGALSQFQRSVHTEAATTLFLKVTNHGANGEYTVQVNGDVNPMPAGESASTAPPIDVAPAIGTIDSVNDEDWYKISTEGGRSYSLDLVSPAGIAVELVDVDGNSIASATNTNNFNGNAPTLIRWTATDSQPYFAILRSKFALGDYQLTSNLSTTLPLSQTTHVPAGRLFQFEATAGTAYVLTIEDDFVSEQIVDFKSVDGSHQIETSSSDNNRIYFRATSDHTYAGIVDGGDVQFGGATITIQPVSEIPDLHADDAAAATVVDHDFQGGTLSRPDDIDTFAIPSQAGRHYRLDVFLPNFTTAHVTVTAPDGTSLGEIDATDQHAIDWLADQTGSYIVAISSREGQIGDYRFRLTDRDVTGRQVPNLPYTDTIGRDVDRLRVDLEAGVSYRVATDPATDVTIQALETSQTARSSAGNSTQVFAPETSGTYLFEFPRVRPDLVALAIEELGDEVGQTAATSERLLVGEQVVSHLTNSEDIDWFSTGVEAGTFYRASITATAAWPAVQLHVLDAAEATINQSVSSATNAEVIWQPQTTGENYVAVESLSGEVSEYDLVINELKHVRPLTSLEAESFEGVANEPLLFVAHVGSGEQWSLQTNTAAHLRITSYSGHIVSNSSLPNSPNEILWQPFGNDTSAILEIVPEVDGPIDVSWTQRIAPATTVAVPSTTPLTFIQGTASQYSFDAVEAATYSISLTTDDSASLSKQASIDVRDPSGVTVASSGMIELGIGPNIQFKAATAGSYEIRVRNESILFSSLALTINEQDNDDHGDTPQTATEFSTPAEPLAVYIAGPHDPDWLAFNATAGRPHRFDVMALGNDDVSVMITSGTNDGATTLTTLPFATTTVGQDEFVWVAESTGQHFVRITSMAPTSLEVAVSTPVGDSNLDGRFRSDDLVQVFSTGLYEQDALANWGTGDWDGDLRFSTRDLVYALSKSDYE